MCYSPESGAVLAVDERVQYGRIVKPILEYSEASFDALQIQRDVCPLKLILSAQHGNEGGFSAELAYAACVYTGAHDLDVAQA